MNKKVIEVLEQQIAGKAQELNHRKIDIERQAKNLQDDENDLNELRIGLEDYRRQFRPVAPVNTHY